MCKQNARHSRVHRVYQRSNARAHSSLCHQNAVVDAVPDETLEHWHVESKFSGHLVIRRGSPVMKQKKVAVNIPTWSDSYHMDAQYRRCSRSQRAYDTSWKSRWPLHIQQCHKSFQVAVPWPELPAVVWPFPKVVAQVAFNTSTMSSIRAIQTVQSNEPWNALQLVMIANQHQMLNIHRKHRQYLGFCEFGGLLDTNNGRMESSKEILRKVKKKKKPSESQFYLTKMYVRSLVYFTDDVTQTCSSEDQKRIIEKPGCADPILQRKNRIILQTFTTTMYGIVQLCKEIQNVRIKQS